MAKEIMNTEIDTEDSYADEPINPDDCNFMSQDCEGCPHIEYCIATKKNN